MLKTHLQRLQIFKSVKMIVNEITFVLYDFLLNNIINVLILWLHAFLNDLLFYFIVFIFISSVPVEMPRHTTTHQKICNNIELCIGFSVTTLAIACERIIHTIIESPHKNIKKIKNCASKNQSVHVVLLHWNNIYDLLSDVTNEADRQCSGASGNTQLLCQLDQAFGTFNGNDQSKHTLVAFLNLNKYEKKREKEKVT